MIRFMYWLEGVLRALLGLEPPRKLQDRSKAPRDPEVYLGRDRYHRALQAAHREAEDPN